LLQDKHMHKKTKKQKQKNKKLETMGLFGKGFLVTLFKFCGNTCG